MLTTAIKTDHLTTKTWYWQNHAIKYNVTGEGKPLFLIHGFGGSIGHWRKNIPELAIGGYQIYTIDLLGFGASDKPQLDYSLDFWAEIIVDFWQENINRPTVFIGNSIGALLALTIAARHPKICAGTVLINCAYGLKHRPQDLIWIVRSIVEIFTNIAISPAFGPLLFNWVRHPQNVKNTLYQVYPRKEAVTDELIKIICEPAMTEGAREVFNSIITAPAGTPPEELLPDVQSPILLIWGEKDPWTPIKGAKVFQEATTKYQIDLEFLLVPKAGHCTHDEYPEIVNPAILKWLKKIGN